MPAHKDHKKMPPGMHMHGGHMMKDSEMPKKPGHKGKGKKK